MLSYFKITIFTSRAIYPVVLADSKLKPTVIGLVGPTPKHFTHEYNLSLEGRRVNGSNAGRVLLGSTVLLYPGR